MPRQDCSGLNKAKSPQLEGEPRNIQVKLDAKYDENSGVLFNAKVSMFST
jgi:hypothetical protein